MSRRLLIVAAAGILVLCGGGCGSGASPTSGNVYWVTDSGVNAVAVGGGRVATVAPTGLPSMAMAVDGGHVYWAGGSGIEEIALPGGKTTTIATAGNPVSVAVDGHNVYWVESIHDRLPSGFWGNFAGTVNEAPLAGGHVTTLARGQVLPRAVAVDGTHVYWVDGGGCATCGDVKEVPIGGGHVTTLASDQNSPISVAVNGGDVYWISRLLGTVNEVPAGGGRVTTLARGQNGPVSLAVDGRHIYWVNYYDGTVNAIPVRGGTITVLARGQDRPSSVAVDGSHVYWIDSGGHSGTVRDVPLGGGRVRTLARGQASPGALAVGPYLASHPAGSTGPAAAVRPAGLVGPKQPSAMIGSLGDGPTGAFGPTGDYAAGEDYPANELVVPRIGPLLLSAAGLAAEAKLIGQRIFWAGPKAGYSYELTRDVSGAVHIRYLPHGVAAGAPGEGFLIVATYPFISAYGTLREYGQYPGPRGAKTVFSGPGRTLIYATADNPKSALLAFQGDCPRSRWERECGPPYQIEIYDPAPPVSARVDVQSGRVKVTPVG